MLAPSSSQDSQYRLEPFHPVSDRNSGTGNVHTVEEMLTRALLALYLTEKWDDHMVQALFTEFEEAGNIYHEASRAAKRNNIAEAEVCSTSHDEGKSVRFVGRGPDLRLHQVQNAQH